MCSTYNNLNLFLYLSERETLKTEMLMSNNINILNQTHLIAVWVPHHYNFLLWCIRLVSSCYGKASLSAQFHFQAIFLHSSSPGLALIDGKVRSECESMSQQDGRGHLSPPNGSVEFLSNFLSENLDGVILLVNSMTPGLHPGSSGGRW